MVQAKLLLRPLLALVVFLAVGPLTLPFIAHAQPAKAARVGYLSGNPSADTGSGCGPGRGHSGIGPVSALPSTQAHPWPPHQ